MTWPRQMASDAAESVIQGDLLVADGVGFVLGEIKLVVQELLGQLDVFVDALHVPVENLEGGGHGGFVVVTVEEKVAEAVSVLGGEFVDVSLEEEEVGGVEGQEVIFQPPLRHLGRDRRLQVMVLLEQSAHDATDFGVTVGMDGDRLDRRAERRGRRPTGDCVSGLGLILSPCGPGVSANGWRPVGVGVEASGADRRRSGVNGVANR